jgi:ribosomal protein S6
LKTYETVIILDDRKVQDEGKAFKEEFSSMISRAGGEIIKATPLGRKTFAREMKKRKTGFYWDFIFDLNEKEIKALPEKYRLDERVLRLQAFIYDRPEDPRAVKEEPALEEETVTETVKAE